MSITPHRIGGSRFVTVAGYSRQTKRKASVMTTIVVQAGALRDLLTGCLLSVGKDYALPVLTMVQLRAAGGSLRAACTDRYSLVRGEVKATIEGEDVEVLVPAELASRIVKLTPKAPRFGAEAWSATLTVEYSVAALPATLTGRWLDGTVVAGDLGVGAFPKVDALFPEGEPVPTGEVMFNPAKLAALSKLPRAHNLAPLQLTFHNRGMAVLTVEHDSVEWNALLMPVRVNA